MKEAVWLAERAYGGPSDILGLFSTPEKAKKACQDQADQFFGASNTSQLGWRDYEGHSSAPYHHPANGMCLFAVTRYLVDDVPER